MEINLDNQKNRILQEQNLDLDFWDKIFWQNSHIQINNKKNTKIEIEKTISNQLNDFLKILDNPTFFEIKPQNNAELERLFNTQTAKLLAEGKLQEAKEREKNKPQELKKLAESFSAKQFDEFFNLASLLKKSNYPNSFKALILNEAISNIYKQDGNNLLVSKRKIGTSIAALPNFSESVLKFVFENAQNETSFKNLYKKAQNSFRQEVLENVATVNFDGINTFNKGKWKIFPSKEKDEANFFKNVQELTNLVDKTPWCTRTLASTHLENGDFYVFLDNESKPRIAILMEGNAISEIRGLGNKFYEDQEIEDDFRDVVLNFLQNNTDFEMGKNWLEKEEWNKRLVTYKAQIENNTFEEKNLENLLKDLCHHDFQRHNPTNSNVEALKEQMPKLKTMLAKHFNCKEDEICCGNFQFKGDKCPVVVLGNLNFLGNESNQNTQKLKFVLGDLFNTNNLKSLDNLEFVGGDANFGRSKIESLPKLEFAGILNLFKTKIKILPKLKTVSHNLSCGECEIEEIPNLEYVGDSASFDGSNIKNLKKLKLVDYSLNLVNCKDVDLSSMEFVGHNAYFDGLKTNEIPNLRIVEGTLSCEKAAIKSMPKLKIVGKNAVFCESQIENLNNLEYVGDCADFQKTCIKILPKLKIIKGSALFCFSKIKKLAKLEKICGKIANFENSDIEDLSSLKFVAENNLNLNNTKLKYNKALQKFMTNMNYQTFKI